MLGAGSKAAPLLEQRVGFNRWLPHSQGATVMNTDSTQLTILTQFMFPDSMFSLCVVYQVNSMADPPAVTCVLLTWANMLPSVTHSGV